MIDSEDEMLNIGLKLHEVTERIMATEFLEYEVQLLEESVVDYLEMRRSIRSQNPDSFNKPKPKHHFISYGLQPNN